MGFAAQTLGSRHSVRRGGFGRHHPGSGWRLAPGGALAIGIIAGLVWLLGLGLSQASPWKYDDSLTFWRLRRRRHCRGDLDRASAMGVVGGEAARLLIDGQIQARSSPRFYGVEGDGDLYRHRQPDPAENRVIDPGSGQRRG